MLSDVDRELLRQIFAQAEKLTSEVRRLRGDVTRLHSRIVPFEDDVTITEVPSERGVRGEHQRTWRLVDALNSLAGARREIVNAEMHLNAIRGRMDEIASDAISRDEMKPYINQPPRRSRGRGDE